MKGGLGWGVIGCGDVFEKKSGPAIVAAQRSRLVSLTRRNAAERQRLATIFQVAKAPAEAEAVVQDPEVDVVYIATPPSSHGEFVRLAAAAGKHVLVEKPMGLTAQDSQAMVAACAAAGVQLFVAYYRRFHPHVLAMKQIIDEGEIGTPQHAFIDFALPWENSGDGWRLDPDVNGGGFFVDMGSHRLDLWIYLFGEPITVSGLVQPWPDNPRIEQAVSLCVGFKNGVQGLVRSDFCTNRVADRFEIIGSAGRILSDPLDGHSFSLQGKSPREVKCERLAAPHLGLVEHIETVLLDKQLNRSPGIGGVATDRILDQLLKRK